MFYVKLIAMKTITNKVLIRKLTVTGALGALTVVLSVTHLGLIPFVSGAAITILQIPVIIAVLMEGLGVGLGVGAIFGISSLIQAAVNPTGVLDPFFINPLVSVVPRMLIAVVTFLVYKLLQSFNKRKQPLLTTVFAGIAAFFGSMANTVFVIGSLYLVYAKDILELAGGNGYFAFMLILLPQALLEAAASVILCVAVIAVKETAVRKKSKLSEEAGVVNKKE